MSTAEEMTNGKLRLDNSNLEQGEGPYIRVPKGVTIKQMEKLEHAVYTSLRPLSEKWGLPYDSIKHNPHKWMRISHGCSTWEAFEKKMDRTQKRAVKKLRSAFGSAATTCTCEGPEAAGQASSRGGEGYPEGDLHALMDPPQESQDAPFKKEPSIFSTVPERKNYADECQDDKEGDAPSSSVYEDDMSPLTVPLDDFHINKDWSILHNDGEPKRRGKFWAGPRTHFQANSRARRGMHTVHTFMKV